MVDQVTHGSIIAMTEKDKKSVMDTLLGLYDWDIRFTTPSYISDYTCGRADAFGQAILDMGKLFGESFGTPYKYEAYKRVMEYDTTENYWKKYPTPLSNVFPAEIIRENGGKL